MFDTITDVFMSIVGVAILLICFNTIFSMLFNTQFAKKMISYLSLFVYAIFLIGAIFYREESQDVFYIALLIFLVLMGGMFFASAIKSAVKSANEYFEMLEIEKRCRSCKYFDECDECFIKDCPYYEMAEPEEFEEDL